MVQVPFVCAYFFGRVSVAGNATLAGRGLGTPKNQLL